MVSELGSSLSGGAMIDPAMDPVDRAILACKQMLAMLSARVVQTEDSGVDEELADSSDSATGTPDGAAPARCSTLGFSPNVGSAEVGFASMQPDDSSVDQELAYDLDNATSSPDAVVPAKCSTVGLDPNIGAVEVVDSSQKSGIVSTVNPGLVGAPPSSTVQQFSILKPGEHTPTTCSTGVLDTDAKSAKRDCTLQEGMASIRAVAALLPAATPPHPPDQPGLLLGWPPPWPEWMASSPSTGEDRLYIVPLTAGADASHTPVLPQFTVLEDEVDATQLYIRAVLASTPSSPQVHATLHIADTCNEIQMANFMPFYPGTKLQSSVIAWVPIPPDSSEWSCKISPCGILINYRQYNRLLADALGSIVAWKVDRKWCYKGILKEIAMNLAMSWDPGERLIVQWLYSFGCCQVNIVDWSGQQHINGATLVSSVHSALPCGISLDVSLFCKHEYVYTHLDGKATQLDFREQWCCIHYKMQLIIRRFEILDADTVQPTLRECEETWCIGWFLSQQNNSSEQQSQGHVHMMLSLEPKLSTVTHTSVAGVIRCAESFSPHSLLSMIVQADHSTAEIMLQNLSASDNCFGNLIMLSASVHWDPDVFNKLSTTTLQSELVEQHNSDLSAAGGAYTVTFCGDRNGKHDHRLRLWVLSPSACGQARILGEVKRVYTSPSIALPHTSTCSHAQLSETVVSASAGDISNATRLIWVLGANVVTFSDSGDHPFVLTGYIISYGHSAYGGEYNGEIVGKKITSTADSMLPDLTANIAATQNMLPRKSPFVAFCGDTAVDLVRLPVTIPWNPGVCNQLSKEEVQSELLEQHNSGENTSSGSKNIDLCAAWVTGENFLARPSSGSAAFCGDNSGCLVMLSITVLCDKVFCYQLSREVSGTCFVHAVVGKHSAHYSFLRATEHGTMIRNVHHICVQAALFLHMMAPLQQKHPRAFLTSYQLNGLWLWDPGGLQPTLGLRASRNLRRGDCHGLGRQGGPWWTVGRGLGQDDDACNYIRASDGTEKDRTRQTLR